MSLAGVLYFTMVVSITFPMIMTVVIPVNLCGRGRAGVTLFRIARYQGD